MSTSQNNSMVSKYIPCSCHSEGLNIASFPGDPSVYLSMYYIGRSHSLTWWERIKCCWSILRTGQLYNDQLILNKPEVTELISHLVDLQKE